jgi:4-aminobutyrate aminotransferase-like enzyme
VEDAVEAGRRSGYPVGAVIVEPIQGRGGGIVPPDDFLPALRSLCDTLDLVLILDEVYTGLGRTGRWFACEHWGVVPDLLVVGKALAGGLPLSVVVGRPAVMEAWPASDGEALHTSTFLGNPMACAAAIANLDQIESLGLVERSDGLGRRLASRLDDWVETGRATATRGLGLMRAAIPAGPEPAAARSAAAATAALAAGVILLPEGDALAFTPPLVITEAQLDHALDVVESVLEPAG